MVSAVSSAARTLQQEESSTAHHDDEALEQDVRDRVQRVADQVRPVVDRHDAHAAGAAGCVQLVHRVVDRRVRTSLGFSPRRMSTMPSTPPAPSGSSSSREDAGLRQRRRSARARCRGRRSARPWARRARCSRCPRRDWIRPEPRIGQRLLADVEQRAAGVPVVGLHRVGDLADAEPVLVERARIDLDLVLADQAAERRDVGDARDLEQARARSPSPGARAAAWRRGRRPPACSGRTRRCRVDSGAERRRDAVGQLGVAQLARGRAGGRSSRRCRRRRSARRREPEDRARAAAR